MAEFFEAVNNNDFLIIDKNDLEKFKCNCLVMKGGFVLSLCTCGYLEISINLIKHTVKKNMLLMITPHSVIELHEKSEDLIIRTLFFNFDLISNTKIINDYKVISKLSKYPCIYLVENTMNDLVEYYDFLVKQHNCVSHEYRKVIISSLLSALTFKICTIYKILEVSDQGLSLTRKQVVVDDFKKLLFANYITHRNINFYADKLNLTTKHLSKVVKSVTGKSILFWVNMILMADAKYMLKTSDLSVKEISDELGFPSPSLFGRFFKKYANMTPLKYKKHIA